MSNIPIPDPTEMEKLMADLDAVDFDDLDDDFRGVTINEDQWSKYQLIVKALLTAKNKGQGISKVEYLTAPNPLSEYAGVMIVLGKLASLDGDAKAAAIMAASLCDRVTITTNGDNVRISFTVDTIWKEDNHHAH
jgi:hypothetical protein